MSKFGCLQHFYESSTIQLHIYCMVEAGTSSLPVKVHPEKNRNQKNSTVRNREFDVLILIVEFFGLWIFSLGALLPANSC